ncbi:hypothetical protein EYF80_010040 [Liparis tanakae]|uniref:Uncharacterized protein n=1 Tax=Liparis tanakae TaxID=230148 RepID=A0A4Z2IP76_9TELE|nr:hypothetical protein EYF80_010040 [Liparis tanakae]
MGVGGRTGGARSPSFLSIHRQVEAEISTILGRNHRNHMDFASLESDRARVRCRDAQCLLCYHVSATEEEEGRRRRKKKKK